MFRPLAPQVQDHLLENLSARLDGVACSLGYPVGGLAAEQVWVAGDFDADMPRAVSGYGGRDEEGAVEIRVSVMQTTAVYTDVRDRAVEIAGELEDLIVEDPTLGGLVSDSHVHHVKASEAHPEERTIQCGLTITVVYQGSVSAS